MTLKTTVIVPWLMASLLTGCAAKTLPWSSTPSASGPDPFEAAQPVGADGTPYPAGPRQADVWFLNGDHRAPSPLPEGAVTSYRVLDDTALPDDTVPSSQAVVDARNAALEEPVASSFVGAAAVHPYVDGVVYKVHTAPGALTTISLEAGEQIQELAAGDTSRWLIREASSGAGDSTRPLLFIKPLQPKLSNNLTIATSKRVYHLDLESHAKGQYQTEIAWRYPHAARTAALASPRDGQVLDKSIGGQTGQTSVVVGDLDFGYRIDSYSGYNPDWMPLRAFHDGAKTYIEFPADVTTKPPLFVIKGKESEIVNYRLQGNTYVVDRVLDVAELRLGNDDQTVVRVTRTGN